MTDHPAPYRHITVRPLSGSIGAEIGGIDLTADLDDARFAEIRRAFREHLVVVFRDQGLGIEPLIAFAKRFGPLIVDRIVKAHEEHPELLVVIKEPHERIAFGEGWHSDSTFLERPPMASFLHAIEVPPYGGDTLFANQYLAYETLSPGLRRQLDGLTAIRSAIGYTRVIDQGHYGPDRAVKLRHDDVMAETVHGEVEHPVVRIHAETGRKALYVNLGNVLRFKDWTPEESRPLLQYLCEHAVRPEFTCRLRWGVGTLCIWDNRCTMHNPINDYHGARRHMHRVVVEGDRPV